MTRSFLPMMSGRPGENGFYDSKEKNRSEFKSSLGGQLDGQDLQSYVVIIFYTWQFCWWPFWMVRSSFQKISALGDKKDHFESNEPRVCS